MLYWRMMRKDEPNTVVPPMNIQYNTIDYVYSNEMPSHNLYRGERVIWSLAKSPEAALKWAGARGKGKYNRLACYNFQGDEGELFDLTDLKTWVSLIHKNTNGLMINNINGKYLKSIEAIRSIIPCMSSAISMARECEEVIFIPHKRIEFNIIDYDNILRNPPDEKTILTSLSYDNKTIDALLDQLKGYEIGRKQLVIDQLLKLKIA